MKRPFVNPNERSESATSTELLRQAQASNQAAWEQLVQLYSRRMYRWCRRAGLQSADAANVVQETLESVARKLADFRRDRPGDTFRGWLRRITDNKIRDHFRRQRRRQDAATGGTDAQLRLAQMVRCEPEPTTWDTSAGMPPTPQQTELEQTVIQIRSEVSERDWRFFWRVVVDGQSAAEVGREFGVSANAVRLVKMRVLRRLRQRMHGSVAE